MRKMISVCSVLALILAVAVTAFAQNNGNNGNNNGGGNGNGNKEPAVKAQTIFLKGSGSSFNEAGWQNMFNAVTGDKYTVGACGQFPNVWHLVYSGKVFNDVTFLQVTFTNGAVFEWFPDMGPSVNGGGNNMGWVIVAPYDWTIDYVNKGNNNDSGSFIVTNEGGNPQFNISGVKAGKKNDPSKISFSLQKMVGTISIVQWAQVNNCNLTDLAFQLFDASGNCVASTCVNSSGAIVFDCACTEGWYEVRECLKGEAAQKFECPNSLFVYCNGKAVTVDPEFDYNAFYTIVNGYGSGYTLGYPGLNNTGDIFYIGVTNTTTNVEYPSFCANAGSRAFAGQSGMGCTGYHVTTNEVPHYVDGADASIEDFVSALNFIADTYGDLNTNRAITQVVIWTLLEAIDVDSEEFLAIEGWKVDKEAVWNVIDNYKNYKGAGKIHDVVFLVCEHGHDYHDCQPQLVPVYGAPPVFENNPLAP